MDLLIDLLIDLLLLKMGVVVVEVEARVDKDMMERLATTVSGVLRAVAVAVRRAIMARRPTLRERNMLVLSCLS